MKLLIFGVSVIYLLGLKMTTKFEFRTHLAPDRTPLETVDETPSKKTESIEKDQEIIKTDSISAIKSTNNPQKTPTEKGLKKSI